MDKLYSTSFVPEIQDSNNDILMDIHQNNGQETSSVVIECAIKDCKKLFKYTYNYRFNVLSLTIQVY